MKDVALNQELLLDRVQALPAGMLAEIRERAVADVLRFGLPTTRHEDWKYTNLAPAVEFSNAWLARKADEEGPDSEPLHANAAIQHITGQIDAHWLVVRNGTVDSASLEHVSKAVGHAISIVRLAESKDLPELVANDGLSALNAALLRDGLHIVVAADKSIDKPVGVLTVDDPGAGVSQVRTVIDVARGGRLQLVEVELSGADGRQFTNSMTSVKLGESAALDFVRIQQRGDSHLGVNRFAAHLLCDASLSHAAFDFGGDLTRNDVVAEIAAPGADVELLGLYLASGSQHIDNHTTVSHRVGPATSNEEYRGILNGRSRCVFNGKAHVHAGADGTDANQANHNLLLSERAEIDTKPELEIYADDVKCSHGATVGQLDAKALFYLRSRGLDEQAARQLLTRAFAAGTLSMLPIEACRNYLDSAVDERLAELLGSAGSVPDDGS